MKKVAAGYFKTNCLAIMDEVQSTHETVVITKHGKPVVKLAPVKNESDEIYNFLAGKGVVVGDVVSSVISPKKWGVRIGKMKAKRQPGSLKGKLRFGEKFFEPLPASELARWQYSLLRALTASTSG
jgi:prevent-host-death family protein